MFKCIHSILDYGENVRSPVCGSSQARHLENSLNASVDVGETNRAARFLLAFAPL